MGNKIPSIFRIIGNDYLSMTSTLLIPCIWIGYFILGVLGVLSTNSRDINWTTDGPFFYGIAIALTILCVFIIVFRVLIIRNIFANGFETTGQITYVRFSRGRGWVRYTYVYKGQTYPVENDILPNKHTLGLEQRQEVSIVADSKNPRRAFIKTLFF
jgi:hypothetical protein